MKLLGVEGTHGPQCPIAGDATGSDRFDSMVSTAQTLANETSAATR